MTERCRGTCTECGRRRMVWLINEETKLCNECVDLLDYIKCDECGEFFPYDTVEFTDLPDGRTVCEYCLEGVQ